MKNKLIAFVLCGFATLYPSTESGNLFVHNKSSVAIQVIGRKQVNTQTLGSEEFGRDVTIEPNSSFNFGPFAYLLDLSVRQEPGKECYKSQNLPTFEMQKGHVGDDLNVNITFKKSGYFSLSKGTFIITYNWSRPTNGESVIQKIDRPYWHDITELKRTSLDESMSKFTRRTYYFNKNNTNPTSEELLNKPRQVLFSIHGTFARESKEFYDPQDAVFENILAYAESLGDSVEVVSLEWTGANESNARIAAGQFLADLINTHYQDRNKFLSLNTISHSHGGNAVNVATHFALRPFDTIVSLYTPIRTDFEWFTPQAGKFKTLYHFYSTADHIQFLGSINVFKLNAANLFGDWGARKAFAAKAYTSEVGGKIYNIRVEFSGVSPAHVNKEAIVKYLPQLIWYINRTYKINYDLDADIDPQNKEILVSIRHSISPAILESDTTTVEMKQQAQAENEASKKSQAKYLIKYRKEMGKKGWRVINLLRSGKQTALGN